MECHPAPPHARSWPPAAVIAACLACAPASIPARGAGSGAHAVDGACSADPERFVVVEDGDAPLVISSTHAGTAMPLGCDAGSELLRPLAQRSCAQVSDDACASGPCRASGDDRNARLITFALVEDLARCLGARPALALTEVSRSLVDMNRDAHDPGGLQCAMGDRATLPYWEAYHRAIEGLVAHAVEVGGARALLIDLHTYNSLTAAPPPAIMLGTGSPIGHTLPHLVAEDPTLPLLFGDAGLRAHLLGAFAAVDGVKVEPASLTAPIDGLFRGRYVVHRYARVMAGDTATVGPAVDSLQIEISSVLRDDAEAAAQGVADAVCAAFGERLRGGP